jgi:hypothetical protein
LNQKTGSGGSLVVVVVVVAADRYLEEEAEDGLVMICPDKSMK